MNAKPLTTLLRLLVGFYFPFLALLCLAVVGAAVWLLARLSRAPGVLTLLLLALLVLPLTQVVWAFFQLLTQRRGKDWMELRLPRQQLRGLYDLVGGVAKRWGLPAPDEVRLGADTTAHVYEDDRGKRVLVVGGPAVAAFSQEALAGILAHELAHFAAGDTRLSRRAYRRAVVLELLEYRFRLQPVSRLNPLVWLICAYHGVFRLVRAAESRAQEFAADRQAVRQAGKELAAAALIYLHAAERLPWARLSSIIEACVEMNEPMSQVFAEQSRRAQATSESEWHEACRKALKEPTGLLDTHPSLKDRLAAMGVSPRRAVRLALDQSGPPARQLIAGWDRVEKDLTDRLITPYREYHLAKMEAAQVFIGRPLGR